MAKHLAMSLSSRDPVLVSESNENEDFWRAIGGEEPYSSDRRLKVTTVSYYVERNEILLMNEMYMKKNTHFCFKVTWINLKSFYLKHKNYDLCIYFMTWLLR